MFHRAASDLVVRYNTLLKSKGPFTNVKKIVRHPKYVHKANPFKIDYDIAILHVENPINLDLKNVKPVCLPEQDDDSTANTNLVVSGWGKRGESVIGPQQLMTVEVPVVSRKHCND